MWIVVFWQFEYLSDFDAIFLGGLTEPSEEVMEDFSKNREMRQARVEVLFKDYEVRKKI